MEIPENIREQLNNEIFERFEALFQEYVEPKRKVKAEIYLKNVMSEVYEELESLLEVANEQLIPISNRRQVTKKRWLAKELSENDGKGFLHQVDVVAKGFYNEFSNVDIEIVKKAYTYETFEEYRSVKLKELEDWANDLHTHITDFIYLTHKRWTQIESAINNDIHYMIIKTVKEKCPFGESNAILTVPNSITGFPYDHTNRKKINTRELVENKFFRDILFIDDSRKFESRISIEALQEGLMTENLKMLNALDQEILLYLMSLKHDALYQPIPMIVEIGEIVREVYDNDSQKSYRAVKESLIKMDYMELRVIDETTLRTTKVEMFHKVTIEVDEVTKKEVARIIFSEDLIHEFIKNQTVSIYKNTINKFTLNSSKVLIYPLQRQRIYSATHAEEGASIFFNTDITFFRGAFVFGNSKRSRQIKIIEEALDEIKKNKITLKDYNRKGDTFILEFFPFTERERRDLLSNNAPEKFLLKKTVEENPQLQLNLNLES